MTRPFGTNHAMKRRGGVRLAALARRDHRAEGKNGSDSVTAAPPRNNLRDGPIFMFISDGKRVDIYGLSPRFVRNAWLEATACTNWGQVPLLARGAARPAAYARPSAASNERPTP